jgi:hypothetical protein
MKNVLSILVIISLFLAVSCRDSDESLDYKCEMFYIEDMTQLESSFEVLRMNNEERELWQKKVGFHSFEYEAEQFYYNIDQNQFSSIDEIKQFVNKHSDYLQLIEEDNGEYTMETKYYDSPYRYFLNKNAMFQIGKKVCKIYGKYLISVGEERSDELKNASLEQALLIGEPISQIQTVQQKSSSGCGDDVTVRKDNGNERIRLLLQCDYSTPPGQFFTYVTGYFQARPYKKVWPIWYRCERDVSVSINMDISFTNTLGNSNIFSWDYDDSRENVNEIDVYSLGPNYVDIDEEIYFNAFDCWASQENTGKAIALCN